MPVHIDGKKIISAKDRKAWRVWLEKNSEKEERIWLRIYKKDSGKKSVTYVEAVEEALCYGWIDSKANKLDDESFIQTFAKRNPKSLWSSINRARIERLTAEGKMKPGGLKMIELAKASGTWSALEQAERNELPEDLKTALAKNKKALEQFNSFPPSSKRAILEWIMNAKREETRKKRVTETVTLAAKGIRAR